MKRIIGILASVFMLAACTVSNGVASFNTQEAASDASAAAYAVKVIESIPSVSANIPEAQRAQFDAAVADLKAITATIAANTNGSVSVTVGQGWAKQLGNDLSTILQIVSPVVATFVPSASGYISVAEQLVPLINVLVGSVSTEYPKNSDSMQPPMVRARIYQGL